MSITFLENLKNQQSSQQLGSTPIGYSKVRDRTSSLSLTAFCRYYADWAIKFKYAEYI
jgi:hypothetical protein